MSDQTVADPLTHWVVEAVLSGLLLLLGFLARKAFGDMTEALRGFTAELRTMQLTLAQHNTEVTVLQLEVSNLKASSKSHEDRLRDLEMARIHSSDSGVR